jgi:hypothetical protein
MVFVNYGIFERYSLPDGHPEKQMELIGAVFRRNDEYGDWYELVRSIYGDHLTFASVRPNGVLHAVENEISRITPLDDHHVVAFDRYQGDLWDLRGKMRIDLETGVLTPFDPIAEATPMRRPTVVAMGELLVTESEILGIETAVGLGFAFMVDVNIAWIFFATPQPDTAYIPFVQSVGFNADVTDRQADYFEVTVTDRSTGEPAIPQSLSISVQRMV